MQHYINYFNNKRYVNVPNRTENSTNPLPFFVATTGLANGNMSTELYDQFGNFVPRALTNFGVIGSPETNLQAYNFAVIDLGLYLDVHPDDVPTLTLFNRYRKDLVKAEKDYEALHGVLTLTSDQLEGDSWKWLQCFPWEKGESVCGNM